MGETDFGALLQLKTGHEGEIAGLRADIKWLHGEVERLQDEVVPLREQMAVPDYDEAHSVRTRVDGVEWVVFWDRDNRWGLPQVVAIHHGPHNLMDHLTEPPTWANAAMAADVRESALELLEMAA